MNSEWKRDAVKYCDKTLIPAVGKEPPKEAKEGRGINFRINSKRGDIGNGFLALYNRGQISIPVRAPARCDV